MPKSTQAARTTRHRRLKDAWVYAAASLLVAFAVFVLLDTFAIGRVQQVAQAADLSSIVAAEEDSSASAATKNANSSGALSAGKEASTSGASEDGESGLATSSATRSSSASSSEAPSDEASSDEAPSAHSRARGNGPRSHGKGPGQAGPSQGGGSGSSGGGASKRPGSGSRDETSTSAANSTLIANAASASTEGTQIGSYSDENMQITVSQVRAYDTDIYVANIQVTSAEYLKTALAQNSFGRNLKDTTSNMAEQANAVLAINGDYYGFRDDGYVLRNGVLYRDTASSGTDALVVYGDGTMAAASQDSVTAQQLKDAGAWQVLSFGPVLVSDGELAVSAGDEVDQSMGSNPRTAIGMVSPLHYVIVVSDGRTGDNAGLSLYQLAQVLIDNGAAFAYNLDGGGSTTLYFQGEVINNPTSGNRSGERSVSDIVYFG